MSSPTAKPFFLTKDVSQKISLKVYPIEIKQKDLAEQTENFRSKLAKGDLDFGKPAQDLYNLLLKPAEAQLKNKTNLIIVPDSALWDLPFQALQPANNKYLIETAAISYAPSLTALREMAKKNKGKQFADATLLAFGNPTVGKETQDRVKQVFMSESLAPLPEAERLVTSLGKLYGASRSKIFVGAEAREETAKTETPKYRIVQFATHGILNDISPMYSHIVLAQKENSSNEDGLLEAWEMKDLQLNADMVILSACETARGRFGSGEGVIGMSWALFIAGAPTTVASQWKVESSSTTELMLEFHRQLLTGKNISKAEALRRASLKLMKSAQYKHPSYWAGFVMVGDGF
jgi:CHAT domain-containing protein